MVVFGRHPHRFLYSTLIWGEIDGPAAARARDRLVSKDSVKDEQILRDVSLCCLQQNRAISEEHVGLTVQHPLDTGVIVLHRYHAGIDLELLEATGEPWLARGSLDHRKSLLF